MAVIRNKAITYSWFREWLTEKGHSSDLKTTVPDTSKCLTKEWLTNSSNLQYISNGIDAQGTYIKTVSFTNPYATNQLVVQQDIDYMESTQPTMYRVTVMCHDGITSNIVGYQEYPAGSNVVVDFNSDQGGEYIEVTANPNTRVTQTTSGTSKQVTISNIQSDYTLTASLTEQPKVRLTFYVNEGTTVTGEDDLGITNGSQVSLDSGSDYTFTISLKPCYINLKYKLDPRDSWTSVSQSEYVITVRNILTDKAISVSADPDPSCEPEEENCAQSIAITNASGRTELILGNNQEDSVVLGARVTFADNTTTTTGITWESSNDSVATVGSDGWVRAVSLGTTTITATYEGDGDCADISDTLLITVKNSGVTVVKVFEGCLPVCGVSLDNTDGEYYKVLDEYGNDITDQCVSSAQLLFNDDRTPRIWEVTVDYNGVRTTGELQLCSYYSVTVNVESQQGDSIASPDACTFYNEGDDAVYEITLGPGRYIETVIAGGTVLGPRARFVDFPTNFSYKEPLLYNIGDSVQLVDQYMNKYNRITVTKLADNKARVTIHEISKDQSINYTVVNTQPQECETLYVNVYVDGELDCEQVIENFKYTSTYISPSWVINYFINEYTDKNYSIGNNGQYEIESGEMSGCTVNIYLTSNSKTTLRIRFVDDTSAHDTVTRDVEVVDNKSYYLKTFISGILLYSVNFQSGVDNLGNEFTSSSAVLSNFTPANSQGINVELHYTPNNSGYYQQRCTGVVFDTSSISLSTDDNHNRYISIDNYTRYTIEQHTVNNDFQISEADRQYITYTANWNDKVCVLTIWDVFLNNIEPGQPNGSTLSNACSEKKIVKLTLEVDEHSQSGIIINHGEQCIDLGNGQQQCSSMPIDIMPQPHQ